MIQAVQRKQKMRKPKKEEGNINKSRKFTKKTTKVKIEHVDKTKSYFKRHQSLERLIRRKEVTKNVRNEKGNTTIDILDNEIL